MSAAVPLMAPPIDAVRNMATPTVPARSIVRRAAYSAPEEPLSSAAILTNMLCSPREYALQLTPCRAIRPSHLLLCVNGRVYRARTKDCGGGSHGRIKAPHRSASWPPLRQGFFFVAARFDTT